jgi:hypothetical protein
VSENDPATVTSNLPVPDPTTLTQKAVDRAIESFRELIYMRLDGMDKASALIAAALDKVEGNTERARDDLHVTVDRRIASTRDLLELRLADMDKAIVLVAAQLEKIRTDADQQRDHFRSDTDRLVQAMRELFAEKFDAINTRFLERDTRTEQAADESRTSLAAALAAAKEAVSLQNIANAQAILKSETAVQKQLDALALLMGANQKNMDDKIGDIKERVDKSEGRLVGVDTSTTGQHMQSATDSGLRGNWLAGVSALIALTSVIAVIVMMMTAKG